MNGVTIDSWYQAALKQIAAESYFQNALALPNQIRTRLMRGNSPLNPLDPGDPGDQYVRMVSSQADQFLSKYEVVDQVLNTSTGFSATLLKSTSGGDAGQYTLAFRSTEYKNASKGGDFERDGFHGAGGELFTYGFAYAQLRDMQHFMTEWQSEGGLLHGYFEQGRKLEVIGYSLGAHLATAFTELHTDLVSQTIVFNAAGVGDIGARTPGQAYRAALTNLLARFDQLLVDPSASSIDVETLTSEEQAIRLLALQSSDVPMAGAQGTHADGTSNGASAYENPRYQWARIVVSKEFQTLGFKDIPSPGIDNKLDAEVAARIVQLYGHATHDDSEATANSGLHAPARPIFIEDQPEVEGLPKLPFAAGITADFPGDFANTHSLTLIVDSLAVMRAFMLVDPSLSQREAEVIVAGASNRRARVGIVGLNAPNSAEANSLENALDALRGLFLSGELMETTQFDSAAGGFGQPALREEFHRNIRDFMALAEPLKDKGYSIRSLVPVAQFYGDGDGALNGEPKQEIVLHQADVLLEGAYDLDPVGLAYRYALHALNPFIVIDTQNNGLYSNHGATNLQFYSPSTSRDGLTDQYLQDRAAFLERKLYVTTLNLDQNYVNPNAAFNSNSQPQSLEPRGLGYQNEAKAFIDLASGFGVASGSANRHSEQQLIFGGAGPDYLIGAGRQDSLYGSLGTDYLDGRAGNDYQEGGEGLDLYTYKITPRFLFPGTNDGNDVVLDPDGGVLRINVGLGAIQGTVVADASVMVSPTQWRSADGRFTYTKQANSSAGVDLLITMSEAPTGSITLRDFRDGDFGIRLWEPQSDPQISTTTTGTPDADRLYGARPSAPVAPDTPGDKIDGGDGNDVIQSDRPNGEVDNGIGDADWIVGGAGRDDIEAGAGNDLAEAGAGGVLDEDVGGDLVYGGSGADRLYADAKLALSDAILHGNGATFIDQKGDAISGGAGDDWIVGSAAHDALLGGGGRDLIIGGAGGDNIFGDSGSTAGVFAWSAVREDGSAGAPITVSLNGFVTVDESPGDADVIYAGAGADWVFGGAADDFIDGGPGDDVLFGEAGSDILIGGAGDDYLVGDNPGIVDEDDEGADYLDGGAGDDTLQGDGGDDILVGGAGTDILRGGGGKDVYVFYRGDGADFLYDDSTGLEGSVLVYGDGFVRSALTIRPGSMILDFGNGERTHLASFDHTDPNAAPAFDYLAFADGSRLSFAEVLDIGFIIDGTSGNDDGHDAEHPVLVGTAFKDRISGFDGDDELQGLQGDDSLDGSAGNDRLFGGQGNDTLIGGFGEDALVGDTGDDFLFAGDGADVLWGGDGDDFLDGSTGRDILLGGAGNDAYVFGVGDHIMDYQGLTCIVFGAGIAPKDLSSRRQLVNGAPVYSVGLNTAATDAQKMFIGIGTDSQLATFEFSDGTILDHASLLRETWVDQAFMVGGAGEDVLEGYAGGDFLQGGDGDDLLRGLRGDDRLEGGAGDDMLDGGSGNDLLIGGSGNDRLVGGVGDERLDGGLGDDAYIIGSGEGHDRIFEGGVDDFDTVEFAAARADATLLRLPNGDLSIVLANGGTVTVVGQFNSAFTRVERLVFGDGVVVESAELDALVVPPVTGGAGDDVLVGTPFSDVLFGGEGSDLLDGGRGDDVLHGGPGIDTYRFRPAGELDRIIEDGGDPSIILLDPALGFSGFTATPSGDDLLLAMPAAESAFLLSDYYRGQANWIVRAATGEEMTASELVDFLAHVQSPATVEGFRERYIDTSRLKYLTYLARSEFAGGVRVNQLPPDDSETIERPAPFFETGSNGTFFLNVASITAGSSDNFLNFVSSGLVIADAGAGDDTINNQGWGFPWEEIGSVDDMGSFLYGGSGSDDIIGSWGSDIVIGGDGDDYLAGSMGNDTYVVLASDSGVDIIDEVSDAWFRSIENSISHNSGRWSSDTLDLVEVPYSAVTFSFGVFDSGNVRANGSKGRFYSTLDMSFGMSAVRVVLPNPDDPLLQTFSGHSYGVETIKFADEVLRLQDIFRMFAVPVVGEAGDEHARIGSGGNDTFTPLDAGLRTSISALGGNDVLQGGYAADWLDGGDGDDRIHAEVGDDVVIGGPGNDVLLGGPGADTYLYSLGDGIDTIIDLSNSGGSNTVVFGEGITPELLSLGLGSLFLRIGASGGIHLESFDPANPYGPRDIDHFFFADGTALGYEALIDRGFDIFGTDGADTLDGTAVADRIRGGQGNDLLAGGLGSDTYFYEMGDGADTIVEPNDPGALDVLRFGVGIDPVTLPVTRNGNDILIGLPTPGHSVSLRNWFAAPERPIDEVQFADGTVWTPEVLESRLSVENHAPVVLDDAALMQEDDVLTTTGNVLANDVDEGPDTVLTVAAPGTFAGVYGTLTLAPNGDYSYVLDNDALAVQSLRADQSVSDVFEYAVTDGELSTAGQLRVLVLGSNDAPVLRGPLEDVPVAEQQPFHLTFGQDVFEDVDAGDALTYSASLMDGSALPAWLSFDAAMRTLSGTPGANDIGVLGVRATATDVGGASASTEFALVVSPASSAIVPGSDGNDTVQTGDGWDVIYGGAGNDKLLGGAGNDLLQGGSGNDKLVAGDGNDVLDGGTGNDVLTGGTGSQFFAGGAGNDVINLGGGNSVIAFNSGDGRDTVYAGSGAANTLSLGGADFDYSKLVFGKDGNDLVLHTGEGDQITFKDWYESSANQTVVDLQVVIDAAAEFDRDGSDPLFNKAVQNFDFRGLVQSFDAAREATGVTTWALSSALTAFHLGGDDGAATGGGLAYWYGTHGDLNGLSLAAAQAIIGAPGFGSDAQSLRPFTGLEDGFARLG